tara:strand:+ start:2047 stop:2718 length:672 start_codon:yes stop_codon:yes gene_type:complete
MFKKLMLMFRALLSLPVRLVWAFFPRGMMQAAVDQAADQVETARVAVGRSKGLKFQLERQVNTDRNNVAKLEKRIESKMKKGDEDGARRNAVALAKARKDLAENEAQLAGATKDYDDNFALLEKHQAQVKDAQKEANRLGVQLELSKAQKAQAALSADLKEGLGGSILGDAKANLQGQIDANRGIAETTRDLARDDDDLDDEEDELNEADDILAEFRKGKAAE